jgi:hypothetical protein
LFSIGSGVAAPLHDRVGIGAAEAVVTRSRKVAAVDRQLEGGELRVLSLDARRNLVHRDRGLQIRTIRALGWHAGQESG